MASGTPDFFVASTQSLMVLLGELPRVRNTVGARLNRTMGRKSLIASYGKSFITTGFTDVVEVVAVSRV